jgi:hypothetical protein
MPALWMKKSVVDGTAAQNVKVLRAAFRDLGLGRPATLKDPANSNELWYVWNSPNIGHDDLTLMGSTMWALAQPGGFPHTKAAQVYKGATQNLSDFLYGVLVGTGAPLEFVEDMSLDPGLDAYTQVFEANAGVIAWAGAANEFPTGWVHPSTPDGVPLHSLLTPFGSTWADITQTDLESLVKADLQTIADDLGLTVTGTGSGGSVLKADLVAAILAFAQAQ